MRAEGQQRPAVGPSGGGANAAYELGILRGLFTGQSPATGSRAVEPDSVSRTAAGAFNASFLASLWDVYGQAAVTYLETVWLDRLSSEGRSSSAMGGYRYLANPLVFFDPRNFLATPLASISRLTDD